MASRIIFTPPRRNFGWLRLSRIILVVCLTVLISPPIFSQVKIREKIEIEPKTPLQINLTETSPASEALEVDSDVNGYFPQAGMEIFISVNGITLVSLTSPLSVAYLSTLPREYQIGLMNAGTIIAPFGVQTLLSHWDSDNPDAIIVESTMPLTYYLRDIPPPAIFRKFVYYTNYEDTYSTDPNDHVPWAYINARSRLKYFAAEISKAEMQPGERAQLTLHACDVSGGGVKISDNVILDFTPIGPLKIADGGEGSMYHIQWGTAKNGLEVIADSVMGNGGTFAAGMDIRCVYSDTISQVRTMIKGTKGVDHYAVQIVPDTVEYSETGKIYVQAKDIENNDIVPPQPVVLSMMIVNRPEGGGGDHGGVAVSVKPKSFLKVKNSATQSALIDIYPYGYLTNPDGTMSDNMNDIPYDLAHEGGIGYVAEGDSLKDKVMAGVKISSVDQSGSMGTGSVCVKRELNHFDIRFERDTVAFTETARIFVQAKDAKNDSIEIDDNKLLKLSVTANDGYGTFIDKNGDTLKTTPVELTDERYGDAKYGLIKFAVVKKNPDSVVVCKIHVELQEDASKKGDTSIVVVEQTLKIVMEDPREVLPIKLSGYDNDPITNANKKRFIIQLTRKKEAVPYDPFILTTNYVDHSGGHQHVTTTRRTETRDNYGHFILTRDNTIYDRPYNGQTQNDGRETFDYVASIFGDSMRIIVQSADPVKKPFLKDSITIVEKVPGLQPLTSGNNHLITFTSNANHSLENSDYGTSNVCNSVASAVQDYAGEFGLQDDIFLAAIDMSLPYGGKFDINGTWTGSHTFHRAGKSVDFSHTYRGIAGNVIEIQFFRDDELIRTTDQINEDVLDRYFNLAGFDRKERNKIHYESRN